VKPPVAVRLHAFYDDGITDFKGDPRCGICGLPKKNRTHQIPDQDLPAAEVEARQLGEKLNGASE